jgi:hypothetical protein
MVYNKYRPTFQCWNFGPQRYMNLKIDVKVSEKHTASTYMVEWQGFWNAGVYLQSAWRYNAYYQHWHTDDWFLHHEGNVSRFEWSAVELLIPSFSLLAYVQTLQSICSCTQAGVNCIVHYVREVARDGSTRQAVSWSRLGLATAFWRLTRQTDHLDRTKLFVSNKKQKQRNRSTVLVTWRFPRLKERCYFWNYSCTRISHCFFKNKFAAIPNLQLWM